MPFQIIVDKSVEKNIDKFADEVVERLNEKMEMIAENPRGQGVKKMKGRNAYRARVGDYRLIYTIDDAKRTITIIDVGNRKDIYR
jgi:mRNA interferase RelE/StbE